LFPTEIFAGGVVEFEEAAIAVAEAAEIGG
jgi:hypothetical protein